MKPSGIVTLLTDFGLEDAYVGAMKGAVLSVYARAAVVDLTHGVRPFAVLQGAFLLDSAWRSFPPGTVHVAVVDPGVGTERSAIAFKAADHYFVGPDNGVFTFLNDPISETVELATPPEAAPTFHGRDVFAPVAAKLAAGAALAEVGRLRQAEPVRLPDAWASKVGEAWRAQALHCDHFGNVISNLPIRALARIKAANGTRVRTVETYEDAQPNELVAGAALAEVGRPRRAEPLRLPDGWASKVGEAWRAQALHCDHFGNVISNLPIRALARIKAANGTRVRTVETYEDAQPNELVALVGSSGRIEFALREGSAAARLHVAPGETLLVT